MSSCSKPRTKAPRSIRNRRNAGFSSSPSAQMVGEIDDVLIQILSFLPVKALLRFKRVSKRWLSLITNPDFSNRFIKSKHPLPISGYFLQETRNTKYRFVSLDDAVDNERLSLSYSFRFADHPSKMIIVQSTNGLLLCQCSCSSDQFDPSYYVYNPTTKQNTLLPPIMAPVALSLAFDPSKSPHYKVFCLRRNHEAPITYSDHDLFDIEVYSSNEGPWRTLLSVPSFNVPLNISELCNTIFWNGALHWFGYDSTEYITFDIDQETITILPFPDVPDVDEELADIAIGTFRFLEESRGNLYFMEVNDTTSSNLLVYEMEKDGSSWTLKYNIDLQPLAAAFPEMIRTEDNTDRQTYEFSVFGFVNGETDAESYILLHIPNGVVKYNFNDKTSKKLCGFGALVNFDPAGYRKSFQFIESLANV